MKKGLLFLIAILAFAPLAVCQAADPGITFQSTLPTGGSVYDLDLSGNYAYVLNFDSGLYIMDITAPEAPEEIGSLDITQGRHIDIFGSYAYISSLNGLEIIDISTSTAPTLVGTYSDASGDVSVNGNYAYIADDGYIKIINISTPASPTLTATYTTTDSATGLTAFGDYIYFSDVNNFTVVDVYNPATPTLAGYIDIVNTSVSPVMGAVTNDTYISGDYAYLAAYGAGLIIIDISNHADMQITGCSTTLARSYGVSVSGNYAYLASADLGLEVFNITDLANPSLIGTDYSDTLYESRKIITSGNYAYLAASGLGFRTLNITDPSSVALLSTTQFEGVSKNPTIIDHYLYINDAQSGLRVYDISDTLNPQLLTIYKSEITSLFTGTDIAINDSYGLMNLGDTDTYGLVEVLDLSDPENPAYAGEIHTDYYPVSIALNGRYAYVTDQSGLYIYDLASYPDPDAPTSPELLGSLSSIGNISYIADNKLYLTSDTDDLTIVNISDSTNPEVYSSYSSGQIDAILGLDVSGNYVFLTTFNEIATDTYEYALKVLDISDISAPTLIETYDFDDVVSKVDVVNDYAYIVGDNPSLQMLDVSDPENPEIIATNDDFDDLYNVTAGTDGVIYVGSNGLYIYTADLDGDEAIDDHSVASRVKGSTDGKIKITFGNSDQREMEIFKYAGDQSVILKRYQSTDYYLALHPQGEKIALVNVITGEIASMRTLTSDTYKYNAFKIATVRGKKAVVAISKDSENNILVSLVQILPRLHILKKKDQAAAVKPAVKVSKTKIKKNKVYLRNKHNHNISKYGVTKKLHLAPKVL